MKTCLDCYHITKIPKPLVCTICKDFSNWVDKDRPKDIPSENHLPESPKNTEYDVVAKPLHYNQGSIECLDAIESAVTGLVGMEAVCTGHIIRYIWRFKHKNGVEDLRKAKEYLERLIKLVEAKK